MKVTVTYEEAIALIKEKYNLADSVEVVIEPETGKTESPVEVNPRKEVPKDWDEPWCPDEDIRKENGKVEMRFASGITYKDYANRWSHAWYNGQITHYRKAI